MKQKRLAKTAPIPCIFRDAASEILAEDDLLAENMQRIALHLLDQFRAFVALREKGQFGEAIAAAVFVTPQIVKQRLKLASVAPVLFEVCAQTADARTADGLHGEPRPCASDAVKNSWAKAPYAIRRMLTEALVRASDRRAVLVCVDAAEAAVGAVLRDLFQGDDGGWLKDPALPRDRGAVWLPPRASPSRRSCGRSVRKKGPSVRQPICASGPLAVAKASP